MHGIMATLMRDSLSCPRGSNIVNMETPVNGLTTVISPIVRNRMINRKLLSVVVVRPLVYHVLIVSPFFMIIIITILGLGEEEEE